MSYVKLLVNGARVVNAQQFAAELNSYPDWMPGINRIECGSGPSPSFGKFLITAADFDANWPETDSFDIVIERQWCDEAPTTITLQGYVTVTAQAATRQQDSPMVVTIADARYLLAKSSTNNNWNVGEETSQVWADVLTDLKSDLVPGYHADLDFETSPTYEPSNLKYEGWDTLDALADVASRTGHVLIYDPFAKSLKFSDMAGVQTGLAATLSAARLHRVYDVPETEFSEDVGEVRVCYDNDEGLPAMHVDIDNPASASPRRPKAWATRLTIVESEVQDEADALAQTWFDWATRRTAREASEYFGNLEIYPGSEVSKISWQVDHAEVFCMVDQDAPPEPVTMRQELVNGNGRLIAKLNEDLLPGSTAEATLGTIGNDGCFIPGGDIVVEDIFCYAVACMDDMIPVYFTPGDSTADPVTMDRYFPFEPRQIDGMCAEATGTIAPDTVGTANLMLCCDVIPITVRNNGDTNILNGDSIIVGLHRCPPEDVLVSCDWTCEWQSCPIVGAGGGGGGDCCCQLCLPFGCLQGVDIAFDLGVARCFSAECCCGCDGATICVTRIHCEDNGLSGKTHYFEWTYACEGQADDSGTFEVDLHCYNSECKLVTIPVCGGVDITIGNDVGCFCDCQVNVEALQICAEDLPPNTIATINGACVKYRLGDPNDPYLEVCYTLCKTCPDTSVVCTDYTEDMECNETCLSIPEPVDTCPVVDP